MSNIDGRGAEGAAETVTHLYKPYNSSLTAVETLESDDAFDK